MKQRAFQVHIFMCAYSIDLTVIPLNNQPLKNVADQLKLCLFTCYYIIQISTISRTCMYYYNGFENLFGEWGRIICVL